MSEREINSLEETIKKKKNFDFKFLKSYCKEHGITLLKDYSNEKVTRNIFIDAKCLTPNCKNNVHKNFRRLVNNSGCFCTICTTLNKAAKVRTTCLQNYGVKNPMQMKEIKSKQQETCLKNYGFKNPSQSKEIKAKKQETCLKNHGVKNPMQNAEIAENLLKNCYNRKKYTFSSGRIELIQGYENFALDELVKEGVSDDDIYVKRTEVPEIWYTDLNGDRRRYYIDIYIKSQNRIIEVKSDYTVSCKPENIYLKLKAAREAGYTCELWVYNANGERNNI